MTEDFACRVELEVAGPVRSSAPRFSCTAAGRRTMLRISLLITIFCSFLLPQAYAADNLFNSGRAIKEELSRVSGEGKLFVVAPVDPYLAQSAGVAGAFALTYLFDRDIRSDLRGTHSRTLDGTTDFGNGVGNPFIHIGLAVAVYGAGVAADAPWFTRLGEEMGEAFFLADGTTFVLREAIGRGRPVTGASSTSYRPFQFKNEYDSLPSMHTASSFALAHVLASKTESLPVKILCYATAGFVGFSRLYKDKHWASDVVVGAAIGELAGNSVTRYRSSEKGDLTLAPLSIDGTPSLALMGKF
jgi:membrane-associated phospholipid phosphatase